MGSVEFATCDGDAYTLNVAPDTCARRVLAQLRSEHSVVASSLIVDGARLDGEAPLPLPRDGGCVLLSTRDASPAAAAASASAAGAAGVAPPAARAEIGCLAAAAGQRTPLLSAGEVERLNAFVRWLLPEAEPRDAADALDEVLRDKAQAEQASVDFEVLLEDLYPLPEAKLTALTDMGFPLESSRRALWLNGLDVNKALNYLLEGEQHMQPLSREQFITLKRRHTLAARGDGGGSGGGDRSGSFASYRPAENAWWPALLGTIEDALAVCECEHDLLRAAFAELTQHPQAIFDYVVDPALGPFFCSMLKSRES
eukprot:Rhum_TRINITY_DN10437_c1_g1::Rhum_TRINITY_DN10437_c1_g1_i1::g.38492::m.38492